MYVVDEDEMALATGMYELPTTVDEFLALIVKHHRYFVWFLLSFLILEITFSGSSYATNQHIEEVANKER